MWEDRALAHHPHQQHENLSDPVHRRPDQEARDPQERAAQADHVDHSHAEEDAAQAHDPIRCIRLANLSQHRTR